VRICNKYRKKKSSKVYFRQGDKGDKGDRGFTTTLKGEQFPSGVFEGPPGPPGPPGKHTNEIICIRNKRLNITRQLHSREEYENGVTVTLCESSMQIIYFFSISFESNIVAFSNYIAVIKSYTELEYFLLFASFMFIFHFLDSILHFSLHVLLRSIFSPHYYLIC